MRKKQKQRSPPIFWIKDKKTYFSENKNYKKGKK